MSDTGNTRPSLYDVTPEQLADWMAAQGQPRYRVKQVLDWLPRGLAGPDDLTNLPKSLRMALDEAFDLAGIQLEAKLTSQLDQTTKYIFQLPGGHRVESVWMEYQTGYSVCLSTQSGCRMGCTFCASTGIGFGRNLTSGELFAQVARMARDQNKRVSHVVLMGIGEPLENYEAVVEFLRRLRDPAGLGISLRHVTVSTCGLVPEIKRLAQEQLPITLALSLHAPTDELRAKLMPISRRYPLHEVLEAVFNYAQVTGRRPTFEYALFAGVNDQPKHAHQLAALLKRQLAHVNLIPANEFEGGLYRRPAPSVIRQFQRILTEAGIACTIRRELGGDIAAACGQLRRSREEARR